MKPVSPIEKKDSWVIVVLCLAVFAVYINCLPNIFIFDDHHMIVKNNYLKQIQYIPQFFKGYMTSYPVARGMYRPLLMLTFFFNYLLGGLKPYGYHLINILIHFLNAYFLYFFLKYFFKTIPISVRLGLALIFCVQPINTEAVAYISSRSIILCSLFLLAAFYAYLLWRESGNKRWYLFSAVLYIAALFTKETALIFPLLVAAYEFVYAKDFTRDSIRRIIKGLILVGIITFAYLVLIRLVFGDVFGLFSKTKVAAAAIAQQRSHLANILTQSVVSFFYLYLFFFPFSLCVDHGFPVISRFSDPAGSLSMLLIIVGIGSAVFLRKRLPIISFSILWYFICLVPQFYAKLNVVAAEHHPYMAFFSVYFILAYTVSKLSQIYAPRWAQVMPVKTKIVKLLYLFVFSLFSLLTVMRCLEWRNEYTLWKSTLRVNPHSGIAQGSIAVNLIGRGYVDEGLYYLKQSVSNAQQPATRVISLLNLIYYHTLLGNPAEGMKLLNENKVFLIKEYPFGYFKNLAMIHVKMGHAGEARQALEIAHSIIPEDDEINSLLGWWYLDNSVDLQKAEEYFRVSIKGNPDYLYSHLGLAKVLEKKGFYPGAIEEYKKTVQIAPDSYESYYNIGLLYAMKLFRGEAEWYFKKCIAIKPDFSPAYYNLCVFYLSLPEPDYKRAREYCDKAKEMGYRVDEKIEGILKGK